MLCIVSVCKLLTRLSASKRDLLQVATEWDTVLILLFYYSVSISPGEYIDPVINQSLLTGEVKYEVMIH
jgi:hypothetical protein